VSLLLFESPLFVWSPIVYIFSGVCWSKASFTLSLGQYCEECWPGICSILLTTSTRSRSFWVYCNLNS